MNEQPADSHHLLSAEQIEGDFAYISGLGVDADDLVEITDEDMAQMRLRSHYQPRFRAHRECPAVPRQRSPARLRDQVRHDMAA